MLFNLFLTGPYAPTGKQTLTIILLTLIALTGGGLGFWYYTTQISPPNPAIVFLSDPLKNPNKILTTLHNNYLQPFIQENKENKIEITGYSAKNNNQGITITTKTPTGEHNTYHLNLPDMKRGGNLILFTTNSTTHDYIIYLVPPYGKTIRVLDTRINTNNIEKIDLPESILNSENVPKAIQKYLTENAQ